jgi:hypothetical protein
MSAEFLTSLVAVVLSLAFSYAPGLAGWFGSLVGDRKRLIMLFLLAVVSLAVFGLSCAGLGGDFKIAVTCDKAGAIELLKIFIAAMIANQATYAVTPASKSRS